MEISFRFEKLNTDPLTSDELQEIWSVKFDKNKTGHKKAIGARRKRSLFTKQDGLCFYCGEPTVLTFCRGTKGVRKHPRLFTIEHLKPVKDGGSTSMGNLVGACQTCNQAKGHDNPVLFLWFMTKAKEFYNNSERISQYVNFPA